MPNRKNAKQGADALRAAQHREQAIQLRIEGKSLRQIATLLDVHFTTVGVWLRDEHEALAESNRESTEQLRSQENERLDSIQAELWPYRGDPKVASALIALSRQRAAINGLNRPTEVKVTGNLANQVDVSTLTAEQLEQLDKLLRDAGIE